METREKKIKGDPDKPNQYIIILVWLNAILPGTFVMFLAGWYCSRGGSPRLFRSLQRWSDRQGDEIISDAVLLEWRVEKPVVYCTLVGMDQGD